MAVDLEAVTLQGTYRIGFKPPAGGSLAAGELYIEVGSGAPKLWVGAMEDAGFSGGAGVLGTAEAGPLLPPVNRDVPYVSQDGAVLNCTMGNWDNVPGAYAYQWKLDGVTDVGDGTAAYTFTPADVGHRATCIVTASNPAGAVAAPPSNEVVIEAAPESDAQRAGPPTPRPEEPKVEPKEEEPKTKEQSTRHR